MAGAPCGSDASPPPEAAFRNTVIERVYQGTEPADYPKTARWEWDLNTNKHFIGRQVRRRVVRRTSGWRGRASHPTPGGWQGRGPRERTRVV